MRRFFLVALILMVSLHFTPMAQAAIVQPESVTLSVEIGKKVHQTVIFENDSQEIQSYSLDVSGISFGDSADDLRFEELSSEQRNWIEIDQDSFVIEPGSEQVVEVTVNVADDAEQQLFSFALIATVVNTQGGGIGVTSGLASLFFLEIGGDVSSNVQIESFEIVPKNTRHLPVRFAALLTNAGGGLSEPEVGVVIKNMWGKEVELVSLNATGRRLPGYTNRVFSEVWQGSPWRFGPYTAELYVFPDNSDTVLKAATSVVLFRWRMLGVLAALGLICGGAAYAVARARRR